MTTESSHDEGSFDERVAGMSVEEMSESLKRFGLVDYAVFVAMLASCSAVGLYFGYQDHMKRKRTVTQLRRGSEALDYLMGGRNMKVFPVAMSLVASYVSGITLLGTSTEIYIFGTQYCYILFAIMISAFIMYFTVIPVFHDLQLTSTYEYLQSRFDKKMRVLGSSMFTLSTILWLPIVIYVPALAFNQTTGVDIHVISPAVMTVCILYTCLGGIKAVVWTDVIQIMLMYGTLFLIVIKGTLNVGGLSTIIERNAASGRFEAPDLRLNPTIRTSFWSVVVGGTCFWLNTNGFNQNMIQRYLSLKDVKTARFAVILYVIGVSLMIFLCSFNGLLLFATYHDCDPLTTKLAKAKDQMMPLLVMEILKDIPGLPGLFIAGVFSAALSSLSTGLNSMSAVVLEDFVKPFLKSELSESMSTYIMRGTVLVLGVLSVALVYVVQHLGAVLQLSLSIPAACFGPMLGVYMIGFFIPWIATKATFLGALTGCTSMLALIVKAQVEMAKGNMHHDTKPLTVEGCTYNFTIEANDDALNATQAFLFDERPEKHIYEISYLYYTLVGSMIVIISSFIYSFIFGFQDPKDVDSKLLAPCIRKYIHTEFEKVHYTETNGRDTTVHNFEIKENNCLHNKL